MEELLEYGPIYEEDFYPAEDVYAESCLERYREEHGLNPDEEGFMRGYLA